MDLFNSLKILIIWNFILVVVKGNGISTSDLCRIQIQVSEFITATKDVSMRGVLMDTSEVIVSLDTRYQVTCVTDEKVRLRNHLSLEWSNSSLSDDLTTRLISNTTMNSRSAKSNEILSYLRGTITVKSSEFNSNTVLSLFCRFLTIDPSLYCEKTITLKVFSAQELKSRTMRTWSIVVLVVGLAAILLQLYLRDRIEARKNHTHASSNPPELKWIKSIDDNNDNQAFSSEDENNKVKDDIETSTQSIQVPQIKIQISEKFQTIEISKDDFDFSTLYPKDSKQSANMIIAECNPDISNTPTIKFNERLIN